MMDRMGPGHFHSRHVMTSDPAALATVESTPTTAAGETAQPFAEGRTLGSLSMTSYLLGMQPPAARARG